MDDKETARRIDELSDYIDRLNAGKLPEGCGEMQASEEQEKLYRVARLLKSLKESDLPAGSYPESLAESVARGLKKRRKKRMKLFKPAVAAAAVILVMIAVLNFVLPAGSNNIVHAMEKSYEGIKAYHGILEIVSINAEGTEEKQAEIEVWADKEGRYYTKRLMGWQQGLVTVNNGDKKWQIQPEQKQVVVFPAFPDAYRFTLELGEEVESVKNALEYKVLGHENVSGRKATLLEVVPKGGMPYRLWVDRETGLPLQKESAMQNALQYRVTYTDIEFTGAIPEELMGYQLPEGYDEDTVIAEQVVNGIEEAVELAGFEPVPVVSVPEGFTAAGVSVATGSSAVRFDYVSLDKKSRVSVIQMVASGEFRPASTAITGKVGENEAEILSPVNDEGGLPGVLTPYEGITGITSIRWRQNGLELIVAGNASQDILAEFVMHVSSLNVEFDIDREAAGFKPQVEVPYDMEAEENTQKSVDRGSSPWRLDPVFTAQVFVSMKISPEGISGDYPVSQDELKMIESTMNEAIIEVSSPESPVSKVYLKRVVRQDATGIWTVVGYDPA